MYIIEIQNFTENQWGDWSQIATVQHRVNVDGYSKMVQVEFEFNTKYRIRIMLQADNGNEKEQLLVSRLQEVSLQSKGEELIDAMAWISVLSSLEYCYCIRKAQT